MFIHRNNGITLVLAIAMAAIAVAMFDSGRLLKHAAIALPAIFVIKAASKLECHTSDVALTFAVFVLVLGSKLLSPTTLIPLILEAVALVLVLAFLVTGLPLKEIASAQKRGS